jgi:fibronectin-binding autotransporter adhesin
VGDGGAGSAGFTATLNNVLAGTAGIAKTGDGTLVLGGANTYTGGTAVQGGALSVSADANLGAAGGNVALNGGRLQVTGTTFTGTARDVDVGAAGGGIEVVDAGLNLTASGALSGSGELIKSGEGTLTLAGPSTHTGATTVAAGTLRLGAADMLTPTAPLALADKAGATLDLNGFNQTIGSLSGGGSAGGELKLGSATLTTGGDNTSTTFGGTLSGTGSVVKQGTGDFTLSGTNTYSGATQVNAGTLSAGAANALSAASATSVAAGATLDLGGFSQTVASLTNSGTVSLAGAAPGTTLTVNGPYAGNNGILRLGAVLNATGPSDRLVLNGAGATASGHTTVQIVNLGGLGALTTGNGIEVISALNGATTTAQTTKDAFALSGGHVDAGAYEYRLHAADASGAGENWYLRSTTGGGIPGGPGGPGTAQAATRRPAHLPHRSAAVRRARAATAPGQSSRCWATCTCAAARMRGSTSPIAGGPGRRAWGRVISTDIDVIQRGTANARSDGRLNGFQAGTDLWADARTGAPASTSASSKATSA